MFIASFPIGSVGKNQITDSYDHYNKFANKKNNVTLNFGACQSGGVGLSLKF